MFLDIRNFTAFADAHTPDEVIDYQNRFLGPVIDIINQHQGVVFQILGDGLMATWWRETSAMKTGSSFQSVDRL
jgi:adenylate cyclase